MKDESNDVESRAVGRGNGQILRKIKYFLKNLNSINLPLNDMDLKILDRVLGRLESCFDKISKGGGAV